MLSKITFDSVSTRSPGSRRLARLDVLRDDAHGCPNTGRGRRGLAEVAVWSTEGVSFAIRHRRRTVGGDNLMPAPMSTARNGDVSMDPVTIGGVPLHPGG